MALCYKKKKLINVMCMGLHDPVEVLSDVYADNFTVVYEHDANIYTKTVY